MREKGFDLEMNGILIILRLADLYAQNTCTAQESQSSLNNWKPIGKTFYNNSSGVIGR